MTSASSRPDACHPTLNATDPLPFPNPDPRVDPLPDANQVLGNVAFANGRNPDLLRSPYPGADLIYDGTGTGTCFADSVFATSVPPDLEVRYGCR